MYLFTPILTQQTYKPPHFRASISFKMQKSLLLWLISFITLFHCIIAVPQNLPQDWTNEDVIRNLGIVTDFVFLPDERILVLLKAGRVLMVKGKRTTNIAGDLSNLLGQHYGDRGLISITVDPDFPNKPYIYIGYVWDATPEIINKLFGKYNSTWPRGAADMQGKFCFGLFGRFGFVGGLNFIVNTML